MNKTRWIAVFVLGFLTGAIVLLWWAPKNTRPEGPLPVPPVSSSTSPIVVVSTSTTPVHVFTITASTTPPLTAPVLPPGTSVTTSTPPKPDLPLASVSDPRIGQIIAIVNAERGANGLSPLKESGRLDHAARLKTEDMVAKHYFAHTDPNNPSSTHLSWFAAVGYGIGFYRGENLGQGIGTQNPNYYQTLPDLVNAWMTSPTHRFNILSPKFTETGISISEGPYIEPNGTWMPNKTTLIIAQYFLGPDDTK